MVYCDREGEALHQSKREREQDQENHNNLITQINNADQLSSCLSVLEEGQTISQILTILISDLLTRGSASSD